MPKIKKYYIKSQPDETSCGPSCLYSIYHMLNEKVSFTEVLNSIEQFAEGGGTLSVNLGIDALKRGFQVELHSLNLNIFDPTWFKLSPEKLKQKLIARSKVKTISKKQKNAIHKYIEFLKLGGELKFGEILPRTLAKYLEEETPLLIGLSATWLYQCKRENPIKNKSDDIAGEPAGHFVLAYNYNKKNRSIFIGDPYPSNPVKGRFYHVPIGRFISALYLGVYTYDANILILKKDK